MLTTVSETPRVGRPPKPPEERRSIDVRLRLTPREADAAYQLALKHGGTLNDVIRRALDILAKRRGGFS